MKTRNIFFFILFIAFMAHFCEKIERITMIKIGDAENERSQTVTVNAEIVDLNESETFLSYGFCWSKTENPTLDDLSISKQGTPPKGNFKEELAALTPDTKYYFKAYILTSTDTLLTQQNFFRTQQGQVTSLPVETYEISNYTENSVTLQVNIVLNDGDTLTEKGLVWGTEPNPTKSDNLRLDETDGTAINLEITDLESNATVYIRAFAEINGEIIYTTEKQVTTQATVEPGEITITTAEITDTTATSAKCGGEIISDGDQSILKKGLCWSLDDNPTVDDNIVDYVGTEDEFTLELSGLQPSTTYHVRAFAYSASDTSYGAEKVFATFDEEPENPVDTISVQKGIITFEATNIGVDSATIGGYVSESLANVTEKGLCISTSSGACEIKKPISESDNIFYINSSDLNPSTTYYIRTYAVINAETKYGNEIEFTTNDPYFKVYTKNLTHINENSAKGGGYVEYGGDYNITEKGLRWSTNTDFDAAEFSKKYIGASTDTFNIDIDGLTEKQTYYIWAYVVANGTTYGAKDYKEIKTVEVDPEITTIGYSDLQSKSVIFYGKINNDAYANFGAGFVTSKSPNPIRTTGWKYQTEDKEGEYQYKFTGDYGTTYYVRAHYDEFFGEEFMITFKNGLPNVTIPEINEITPNSITLKADFSKKDTDVYIWSIVFKVSSIDTDNIIKTYSYTSGDNEFSEIMTVTLDGLTPERNYILHAEVTATGGTAYSEEYIFVTPND